jgi:hypothetical protein
MIISHWPLFDEQYACLNRSSRSSPIRLSPNIGESWRECIDDSSLNFRQLVNIHRMNWWKSPQLSSIICQDFGVGVSVSDSVPRNSEPGWFPRSWEPNNLKSNVGFEFLFLGTREPLVTCSKIEDRLYPDICVSKNTQKWFFRKVADSLRNGTLTPLVRCAILLLANFRLTSQSSER